MDNCEEVVNHLKAALGYIVHAINLMPTSTTLAEALLDTQRAIRWIAEDHKYACDTSSEMESLSAHAKTTVAKVEADQAGPSTLKKFFWGI